MVGEKISSISETWIFIRVYAKIKAVGICYNILARITCITTAAGCLAAKDILIPRPDRREVLRPTPHSISPHKHNPLMCRHIQAQSHTTYAPY